jgi:hypothetical protein
VTTRFLAEQSDALAAPAVVPEVVLQAAAQAVLDAPRRAATALPAASPWELGDAYRVNLVASARCEFEWRGAPVTVEFAPGTGLRAGDIDLADGEVVVWADGEKYRSRSSIRVRPRATTPSPKANWSRDCRGWSCRSRCRRAMPSRRARCCSSSKR